MSRGLYALLRLVSRYSHFLQRRFTKAGLLVLSALLACGVVGVDTNQTLAYQLFAFLLVLVLLALAQAPGFKPHIQVKRQLPTYATVGERFEYRVRIHNQSRRSEQGLSLIENTADPRPGYDEFSRSLKKPRRRGSWLVRHSLWQRWQSLLAGRRPARFEEQSLPEIGPDSTVEIRPTVRPQRRGTIRLSGCSIARPDRFGLYKALCTVPEPASVLVLPKRYRLPTLALPGKRTYQHGGLTLANSVGDSEEFLALRDYRPGDPLKQIHWKSFARTGSPVVREYQDEFFERHALVLDTFVESADDICFEEAISVAASFAASIDTQECLLDLLFLAERTYCFTAGRGQLHTENMLEVLAHAQPCDTDRFAELSASLRQRRASLSGCILVLLGWDTARQTLVEELRRAGLPLMVLVISETLQTIAADVHVVHPGRVEQELATL